MGRQGFGAAGGLVLGGAARRFLLLVAAYFATAPFFYDSPAVDVIAGWIAVAGGGILAAAGTTVAVAAFAAAPILGALVGGAVEGLQGLAGHAGHRFADEQGAWAILPAFQVGLFAALWIAFAGGRRAWRRALAGLGGVVLAQAVLGVPVDGAGPPLRLRPPRRPAPRLGAGVARGNGLVAVRSSRVPRARYRVAPGGRGAASRLTRLGNTRRGKGVPALGVTGRRARPSRRRARRVSRAAPTSWYGRARKCALTAGSDVRGGRNPLRLLCFLGIFGNRREEGVAPQSRAMMRQTATSIPSSASARPLMRSFCAFFALTILSYLRTAVHCGRVSGPPIAVRQPHARSCQRSRRVDEAP